MVTIVKILTMKSLFNLCKISTRFAKIVFIPNRPNHLDVAHTHNVLTTKSQNLKIKLAVVRDVCYLFPSNMPPRVSVIMHTKMS